MRRLGGRRRVAVERRDRRRRRRRASRRRRKSERSIMNGFERSGRRRGRRRTGLGSRRRRRGGRRGGRRRRRRGILVPLVSRSCFRCGERSANGLVQSAIEFGRWHRARNGLNSLCSLSSSLSRSFLLRSWFVGDGTTARLHFLLVGCPPPPPPQPPFNALVLPRNPPSSLSPASRSSHR